MTKDEALDLAQGYLDRLIRGLNMDDTSEAVQVRDAIKQARALDKKAENARELGLDYEPVQKQRWAVFCSFCNKEWSVSYQHPGKSVCLDCDDAPPAQPAPVQPVAITEQMAFAFHNVITDGAIGTDDLMDIMRGLEAAFAHITTPPAQPAPVQPVALDVTIDDDDALAYLRDMVVQLDGDLTPIRLIVGDGHSGRGLYVFSADYPDEGGVKIADVATTPPAAKREWTGLTKEEIKSLKKIAIDPVDANGWGFFNRERFAELIEAKLKEKNT
jgi:hypothetical protein